VHWLTDEITDGQLLAEARHSSSDLRSAEDQVLDLLDDGDVAACIADGIGCAACLPTSPRIAATACSRSRDHRGGSPLHEKLFTYLPMSKAIWRLAPDGFPLPKSGPNGRNGPTAAATNARSFLTATITNTRIFM
jgi:hypothetical protein